MKLYASRKIDKISYDYYIGKDVWVCTTSKGYVRFLAKTEKDDEVIYTVNFIPDYRFQPDGYVHCTKQVMKQLISHRYLFPVGYTDQYTIPEPIDCKTTDELFIIEDYDENLLQ